MKVYMKKEDYTSPIVGLLVTLVFSGFSILLLWICFFKNKTQNSSIFNTENYIVFPIAILFSLITIILIYTMFYYLIIGPRKIAAKLIKKEKNAIDGHYIIYMTFEIIDYDKIKKNTIQKEYNCYVFDDNNLIVDKSYYVYIKELSSKIVMVDETPIN